MKKILELKCFESILLILTICAIAFVGLLAPLAADDYCLSNLLHGSVKRGILESAYHLYMTWSGRAVPNLIWSAIFYFKSFGAFFSAFFALVFSSTMILGVRLLPFRFNLSAGILLITLCGSWLAYIPYLGETVYWQTGAVAYILPLFFFAIWIHFYKRIQTKNLSFITIFLLLISSFFIGANHTQLTLLAATFLCVDMIAKKFSEKKFSGITVFGLALLGLCLGGLLEPFSPGASARSNSGVQEFGLDVWIKNFFEVYLWVFGAFKKSFLIFFTMGFCIFIVGDLKNKIVKKDLGLWILKWILPALISMTPFIHFRSYLSERTFVYFVFPMSIACIALGFYISSILLKKHLKIYRVLPLVFFAVFASIYVYFYKQASSFSTSYLERETYIKKQTLAGQKVELQSLQITPPRIFFYEDIYREQSAWIKPCVYDYYRFYK